MMSGFSGVLSNRFLIHPYDSVEIMPYASIKRTKVDNFLKSIRLMNNDYIFVADIDTEHSVRDKKQVLYSHFSHIDGGSIIVVIKEIESWYYAGLTHESAVSLDVPELPSTDNLTKEDFNGLIPRKYDSRIDFMFEILKYFSVDCSRKEKSFIQVFC